MKRRAPALLLVLVFALVFAALRVQAATVTVADGNRLDIDGAGYRLVGADAPDLRQICADGYAAGREAAKALASLVRGRRLDCRGRGRDPSGRTPALCTADGRDLGEAMVRAGMAWADPRTGRAYRDVENDARADRLGVHDHDCLLPWKWRADPR